MFVNISGDVKNSGMSSFTSLVEVKHDLQHPATSKKRRSGQSKRPDCNAICMDVKGSCRSTKEEEENEEFEDEDMFYIKKHEMGLSKYTHCNARQLQARNNDFHTRISLPRGSHQGHYSDQSTSQVDQDSALQQACSDHDRWTDHSSLRFHFRSQLRSMERLRKDENKILSENIYYEQLRVHFFLHGYLPGY